MLLLPPLLKILSASQLIPTSTVLAVLVVSETVALLCLFFPLSWTARFLHCAFFCLLPFSFLISVLTIFQVFDCVQARFKTKIEELPEEIDTSSYMPTAGVAGGSEFLG